MKSDVEHGIMEFKTPSFVTWQIEMRLDMSQQNKAAAATTTATSLVNKLTGADVALPTDWNSNSE